MLPQQLNAAENSQVIHLLMKPNICVLSAAEAYCEDILVAEWKSSDNKNYSLCLYQGSSKKPIKTTIKILSNAGRMLVLAKQSSPKL